MTQARGEEGAAGWTLLCLGCAIFLSLNVMVFTMALWTQDFYAAAGAAGPLERIVHDLFRYLCLLFAMPVLFLLGGPLLQSAIATVRRGRLSADLLILLGVLAAFGYSVVSVLRGEGAVYFEVGCAVLVLVTLGHWLEAQGKLRTAEALEALHRLMPVEARRLQADGSEEQVALNAVAIGDRLRVLPGERIPCDGEVLHGTALVDEQVITGESHPVLKEPGSGLLGGSLALDGELELAVRTPASSGALARLAELVERARRTKGHFERLADRVSALFLPLVLMIAVATVAWHASRHGIDAGILAGLAVVLIACPCALGLATPMALWAALGEAARGHVLFRSGEALESLAGVRAVYFDKTGTLTTGRPVVAQFMASGAEPREVLQLAAALADASVHGHSQAIHEYVEQCARASPELELTVRTLPGRGLVGDMPDRRVLLGSLRLMTEEHCRLDDGLGKTVAEADGMGQPSVCLAWDSEVHGVFVLQETVRPEARSAVEALRSLGLEMAVLTGDGSARGSTLGRDLDIPVQAGLVPEEKVAALAQAQHRLGRVAMVGDGINDAPALASSAVGIALGSGTDIARDSAPVCLLSNDLRRIPWAIELARRTVRVIRQNLFWAFAYNIIGIGLACTGRLNPVLASLAMVLSSLFVVRNSLRGTVAAEPVAVHASRIVPERLMP
jgi:heavy metal translocating P-type ATPase